MNRRIIYLAWLNAGLHVAALALSAMFIRPGSPSVPPAERITYLAGQPAGWFFAWTIWAACALTMVSFALVAAKRIRSPMAKWGLAFAVIGAMADLVCDDLFAFSLPLLAFHAESATETFLRAGRLMNLASLSINNSLYSISTLLLTLALRGRPGLVRGTVPVGVGVFVSGMLLTAAGLSETPEYLLWTTPPTIGLYCVWVLLVARSLTREPEAPARV
jgi:hypothetical protein